MNMNFLSKKIEQRSYIGPPYSTNQFQRKHHFVCFNWKFERYSRVFVVSNYKRVFSVLYGLGQVVTMAQRRVGVDKGTQNHRACRMEASLQSDLLYTTIYQTKYRSQWLAISNQNTLHSNCLSTFFKSVASILHTLWL